MPRTEYIETVRVKFKQIIRKIEEVSRTMNVPDPSIFVSGQRVQLTQQQIDSINAGIVNDLNSSFTEIVSLAQSIPMAEEILIPDPVAPDPETR